MTRVICLHLAGSVALLLIGAIAGSEIAAWPSTVAPSVDAWGDCTPEAALDDPATWAASGKGGRPAHTCLAPDTPPDRKLFNEAYGYDLSPDEWAVALYRLILAQGGTPFVPVDDLPSSPVPLPGTVWAAATAIAALAALKRRTTWIIGLSAKSLRTFRRRARPYSPPTTGPRSTNWPRGS